MDSILQNHDFYNKICILNYIKFVFERTVQGDPRKTDDLKNCLIFEHMKILFLSYDTGSLDFTLCFVMEQFLIH